jgi:hypothetical protein
MGFTYIVIVDLRTSGLFYIDNLRIYGLFHFDSVSEKNLTRIYNQCELNISHPKSFT